MPGHTDPRDHIDDVPSAARPRHVAIIMDGNGRWAAARGLPRRTGHEQGVEAVRQIVEAAGELGLRYLTLYGFSSENWNRSAAEVNDLMGLLRGYIKADLRDLIKRDVRVRIIGERHDLEPDIIELIERAERETAACDTYNLTIAFNYGSRQEMVSAIKSIAEQVAAGTLPPSAIDEALVTRHLYTADLPELDLLIRTSGEMRLSNFLLWQSAYTELCFEEALWPDFTRRHLVEAIRAFAGRERRFGGRQDTSAGGARIDRTG